MENGWIKVSTIEPNTDNFLAYDANCDHICIGKKAWLYRSPEGNLRMLTRCSPGIEVTHWMPLPDAPGGMDMSCKCQECGHRFAR